MKLILCLFIIGFSCLAGRVVQGVPQGLLKVAAQQPVKLASNLLTAPGPKCPPGLIPALCQQIQLSDKLLQIVVNGDSDVRASLNGSFVNKTLDEICPQQCTNLNSEECRLFNLLQIKSKPDLYFGVVSVSINGGAVQDTTISEICSQAAKGELQIKVQNIPPKGLLSLLG